MTRFVSLSIRVLTITETLNAHDIITTTEATMYHTTPSYEKKHVPMFTSNLKKFI